LCQLKTAEAVEQPRAVSTVPKRFQPFPLQLG